MTIDFAALAGAVSDEAPCGPDLDLAGAHGLRDVVFQDRRTQRDID